MTPEQIAGQLIDRLYSVDMDDEMSYAEKYELKIRAIEQAILTERERCAKIAEDMERKTWESVGNPMMPTFNSCIAKAIRGE